ncbi:hypothetical protein Mapa_003548 [Marchantia paleacea]|nr:hypothetical protein Mapa_003548 [Marchantia paleacea]
MAVKRLASSVSAACSNYVFRLLKLHGVRCFEIYRSRRSNCSLIRSRLSNEAPVTLKYRKLLIDGKFVDAASGKTFAIVDPRTEEMIAEVAQGDEEDGN